MTGEFTAEEARILRRYFTNLDKPVFALVNLPEVVKGALFARYSRSPLGLRRLFLQEFVDDLDTAPGDNDNAGAGLRRAEALYDRVFIEYGDDSVAQLGGAHIACQQVSNLLTKVLERGRLMSYLEQSTRYVAYDRLLDGRYRYYSAPEVLASSLGARYTSDIDGMFSAYSEMVKRMQDFFRAAVRKSPGDSDAAYRRAIRARALDAARGMLPAAALSNVGIYGSGQAYEALLMRMRAHPLPEARDCSNAMLTELRKVIPSFLKRVDLPDRGQITTRYLADNETAMDILAGRVFGSSLKQPAEDCPVEEDRVEPVLRAHEHHRDGDSEEDCTVELLDFDPDGEEKMIAAMLYPHTPLSERTVMDRVQAMTAEQRLSVVKAYCGERKNRRHRPGRALERTYYRFDVLSDYGCFRDLQRHRMLTIEWQPLSTRHGYTMPNEIIESGDISTFEKAMALSSGLHEVLLNEFPVHAPYAVALAYRIRYSMQLNAREAMHMLELRTGRQGHQAYRRICQKMHHLIADQAGHRTVAEMMTFVDHGDDAVLGRLAAENRNAAARC